MEKICHPAAPHTPKERFAGGHRGFVLFDRGVQLHELPKRYWMNLDPTVIRRASEWDDGRQSASAS